MDRRRSEEDDEHRNAPPAARSASAIAEADIRVLLMVLVHMTGDMSWLEPPYLPKRDIRLIPDPEAGVPRESRTKSAPRCSSCSRRRAEAGDH